MNGILKTAVLGKVTKVADGTTKTDKKWFRASLAVGLYNFSAKKYYTRFVNVAGFDKVAEAMQSKIKVGCALYAEGEVTPGKPFKTSSGQEITPLDLIARDWSLAGVVPEREAAADEDDFNDPFGE